MNISQQLWPIRCVLATGEHCVLQCPGTQTMREIKMLVWKKKALSDSERRLGRLDDSFVRMAICRHLHLHEDTKLSYIIELYPILNESRKKQQMPDMLIITKDDINDELKMQCLVPSKGEAIIGQGSLSRRRKNSQKFKKSYGVLQSSVLFLFSSLNDYQKGRMAETCVRLGNGVVRTINDVPHGLIVTHSEHCALRFENANSFSQWISFFGIINYRYSKWVMIRLIEELEHTNNIRGEGLFRVAGTHSDVMTLKQSFIAGKEPNFKQCIDHNVMADVLKQTLRELCEPLLIPFSAFNIGSTNSMKSLQILKQSISSLPTMHYGIAYFLIRFLNKVAQHSLVNRMTSANLGIVFAPNLIRFGVNEYTTEMLRSTFNQNTITTLIDKYELIFEDSLIHPATFLRYSDGSTNMGVVTTQNSISESTKSSDQSNLIPYVQIEKSKENSYVQNSSSPSISCQRSFHLPRSITSFFKHTEVDPLSRPFSLEVIETSDRFERSHSPSSQIKPLKVVTKRSFSDSNLSPRFNVTSSPVIDGRIVSISDISTELNVRC